MLVAHSCSRDLALLAHLLQDMEGQRSVVGRPPADRLMGKSYKSLIMHAGPASSWDYEPGDIDDRRLDQYLHRLAGLRSPYRHHQR